MGQSLEFKTWGGGDNAYKWVLHNNGTAPATGYNVTLGDGTETRLYLNSTGVGVSSAGNFRHLLTSTATGDRAWTLADAPGAIYAESLLRATSDTANSTVTPVAVPALAFIPMVVGIYEFEAVILGRSAATNVGVRVRIDAPAHVTLTSWASRGPTGNAAAELIAYGVGTPTVHAGAGVPAITGDYLTVIKGMYEVTSVPTVPAPGPITVSVYSSSAGTAVTLKTNSFIRHRKIS